jgi:branched-subunit amino acid transport protein
MNLALLLLLAAITYLSRAVALVFMPSPPPAMERFLNRVPAPLFAGLAVVSLVGDSGRLADGEILAAAAGALAATRTKSLLWVLVGGLAGYALGALLLGRI